MGTISQNKSSVKGKGYTSTTSEWLVVGDGEIFAQQGGSGSSVWDLEGNLLGMLWGSAHSQGLSHRLEISYSP